MFRVQAARLLELSVCAKTISSLVCVWPSGVEYPRWTGGSTEYLHLSGGRYLSCEPVFQVSRTVNSRTQGNVLKTLITLQVCLNRFKGEKKLY